MTAPAIPAIFEHFLFTAVKDYPAYLGDVSNGATLMEALKKLDDIVDVLVCNSMSLTTSAAVNYLLL